MPDSQGPSVLAAWVGGVEERGRKEREEHGGEASEKWEHFYFCCELPEVPAPLILLFPCKSEIQSRSLPQILYNIPRLEISPDLFTPCKGKHTLDMFMFKSFKLHRKGWSITNVFNASSPTVPHSQCVTTTFVFLSLHMPSLFHLVLNNVSTAFRC